MPETKSCTCIKPIVINGQRLSIGEQIDLVKSQARPLQNGGFITLDDAAGELIRELIREDEEPEVEIGLLQGENNSAEILSETASSQASSNPKSKTIGYELGD